MESLKNLIAVFRQKGNEFSDMVKMGRTQLQDAVPMTSGQEFHAFANNLEEELANIDRHVPLLHEINMGGTAIGTGLNAAPGYADLVTAHLSELTGEHFEKASDMIEATPDTGAYVSYSAALKRLAVKLSKTCNALRLMASGPRCGLHEINLPLMAPGSSIMPGKVNPVIPEVTNQVCFKVIGTRHTPSALLPRPDQLQFNVMEPRHHRVHLREHHLDGSCHGHPPRANARQRGITVNEEAQQPRHGTQLYRYRVTALNPYIGYKKRTQ